MQINDEAYAAILNVAALRAALGMHETILDFLDTYSETLHDDEEERVKEVIEMLKIAREIINDNDYWEQIDISFMKLLEDEMNERTRNNPERN